MQFKKQENKEDIQDGILIELLNEHLTNNTAGIILLGQIMKSIKISIHTMMPHVLILVVLDDALVHKGELVNTSKTVSQSLLYWTML